MKIEDRIDILEDRLNKVANELKEKVPKVPKVPAITLMPDSAIRAWDDITELVGLDKDDPDWAIKVRDYIQKVQAQQTRVWGHVTPSDSNELEWDEEIIIAIENLKQESQARQDHNDVLIHGMRSFVEGKAKAEAELVTEQAYSADLRNLLKKARMSLTAPQPGTAYETLIKSIDEALRE